MKQLSIKELTDTIREALAFKNSNPKTTGMSYTELYVLASRLAQIVRDNPDLEEYIKTNFREVTCHPMDKDKSTPVKELIEYV